MNARQINELKKKLVRSQKNLSKLRDELRGILYDVSELEDCCDRGYDALSQCIDALSELV